MFSIVEYLLCHSASICRPAMSTCQKSQSEREVNSVKSDGLEVQTRSYGWEALHDWRLVVHKRG